MTIWLRSTESTMKDAANLAARGEAHGTVVVAEEQTAGIGRHGHSWHSEMGAGLYLSIILRLPLPPETIPVLTMALGLATQRAVEDVCGVRCDIRWPNDLMLNEKKLAGIMVQAVEKGVLIAGIGVNMNQTDFPEELRSIATSLRIETGQEHAKEALLERIVAGSLTYAALLEFVGKGDVLKQFEAQSSYARGRAVEVNDGNRVFSGVTAGLDENGFLRVETATGIETVMAGGVRAANA
jgi:BirA family transcriptional regulator, biotin operon repressor / biotin---[acetyl-CoA-carboxylase] ligase